MVENKRTRAQRFHRNLLLRSSLLAAMGSVAYGCGTTVFTSEDGSAGAGASSAASSGNGSSQSSSGTGVPTTVCEGAVDVMEPDGTKSGYARCLDGTVHRYDSAQECDTTVNEDRCEGTEMQLNCQSDDDCTERSHGVCASVSYADFGGEVTACGCVYPCANDEDCGDGMACLCNGVVENGVEHSICVSAQCNDGADCPSNECGASSYQDGCGYSMGLGCRDASDACRVDASCEDFQSCALQYGTGPWMCVSDDCAIGRPLLLADGPRTAPTRERSDWSTVVAPDLGMDANTRAALAAHWKRVAALEHASVASFARFSLQLIALGAPPDLLHEAQAAAADEIEHARIAYALASAYAESDIGPGPLDLSDMRVTTDRRTAMLELVAEACVGETLGVAEARELAALVSDRVLREIHTRIADDEQRHAQLAWRALAWMWEGADAALRAEVRQAFETAAASAERSVPQDPPVIASQRGLPSGAELAAIRRQALRDVVLPCAATLFG